MSSDYIICTGKEMIKVKQLIGWKEAYIEALNTENKDPIEPIKEPSDKWKKGLLLAEHSPIRVPTYRFFWSEIPYCFAMHLVRHHVGIQPFVGTQRDDRVQDDISRDDKSQTAPVRLSIMLNCNSIINISRKRLCSCASTETKIAWRGALEELKKVDPITYSVCVQECIYRGFCPERKCCGYIDTKDFAHKLDQYRTKL